MNFPININERMQEYRKDYGELWDEHTERIYMLYLESLQTAYDKGYEDGRALREKGI